MRSLRLVLACAVVLGVLAIPASALAVEPPGIEKFAAVNCKAGAEEGQYENCAHKTVGVELGAPFGKQNYSITEEPTREAAEKEGDVQASGHVPYGVTDFTLRHIGSLPTALPDGVAEHIRTDVAPGLATSPAAVPKCSSSAYGVELVPGSKLFTAPTCSAETLIGKQQATVFVELSKEPVSGVDIALEGNVYNLEPTESAKARASLYGVSLPLPKAVTGAALKEGFEKAEKAGAKPGEGGFPSLAEQKFLEEQQWYAHTLIEGSVEWGVESAGTGKGDYHDYFEIEVSKLLPLISSRLVFYGTKGGHFITNGSTCENPVNVTTRLKVGYEGGFTAERPYQAPLNLTGCAGVPFAPLFSLSPATTMHDEPDGVTAETGLTRHEKAGEIDSAQLKTASIMLPEGMTLNPSAAAGLTACSPAEARIHSATPGVGCAPSSAIGTVNLEVPTLPPGSLTGNVYLGGPESGPITGPPYTFWVDAESARYGVSVRLKAEVIPNEATGQLTTVFNENPEQPFTTIGLHFKQGALAPIANPLTCGTNITQATFTPYTGTPAQTLSSGFTTDLDGSKGACSTPLPFAPTQATANQTSAPAAHTSFRFTLERPNGNQYISQLQTTMPEGLVGLVPAVEQCPEPAASSETIACPAGSQIGTATVQAGSGPTPYTFQGPVYFTGPYAGAPFGLSIKIPAVAGPFNLGTQVTRAKVEIDQSTARVRITSSPPTIRRGVPLRIRRISVNVEKQQFLVNGTNCSQLATESVVSGFTPGTTLTGSANLSTPFQLSSCSSLGFKPSFRQTTSAKTSRANGASLETTIDETAGQANIKSVVVQLPSQLPSRQSTLKQACPENVFAANPYRCPSGSYVGGARANTPTLPSKLTGPAVLVSHGGAAFPDLDLVLEANGVRVILKGNTAIRKGITTTSFLAPPDVFVSSITVNLPVGSHSALGAYGNFCTTPLYAPTTIEGQNGKVIKQNTKIKVNGCGVQIVGRKVIGNQVFLTVKTFSAGRVSMSGSGVSTTYRYYGGAVNSAGISTFAGSGVRKIRVGFVPKNKALPTSVAYTTVFVP